MFNRVDFVELRLPTDRIIHCYDFQEGKCQQQHQATLHYYYIGHDSHHKLPYDLPSKVKLVHLLQTKIPAFSQIFYHYHCWPLIIIPVLDKI